MKKFIPITLLHLAIACSANSLTFNSAFSDGGQQDFNELTEIQKKQNAVIDSLNKNNPISRDYGKIPQTSDPLVAALEGWLSNPMVQGSLRFFSHPALSQMVALVSNSPYSIYIVYAQGVWILAFMILRAWRQSKMTSAKWFRSLFFKLWSTILFFLVSVIAIPAAFLGDSYLKLAALLFQTIFKKG